MNGQKLNKLYRIGAYLFLLVPYMAIIFYFSFWVRITNKFLGWATLLIEILCYYAIYIVINHVIIRKFVPNKTIVIIETLLFLTVCTMCCSDVKYENTDINQYYRTGFGGNTDNEYITIDTTLRYVGR